MNTQRLGRWCFWLGFVALFSFHGLVLNFPDFGLFFYPLAWWSLILLLEGYNSHRNRGLFLARGFRFFLYVCGLSVLLWFIFEAFNLYLGNWYYVLTLDHLPLRWLGAVICYATVLPGLWEVQRAVDELLPAALDNWPEWDVSGWLLGLILVFGLLGVLGPLLAPRYLYPLVWGGLLCWVEFVEFRSDGPTFLARLAAGEYRQLVAWLLAGAICGFLWEFWNSLARMGWIYTVPGFPELRLFEMPLLGYLGFPPFALMTWRLYRFIDRYYRVWSLISRIIFWLGVLLFCGLVLWGMEYYTIASTTVELQDYRGWTRRELRLIKEHNLERPREVLCEIEARPRMRKKARLLQFAGLGTEGANCLLWGNIHSISELRSEPTGPLARLLYSCRGGRYSFWRRRVKDWKYRD